VFVLTGDAELNEGSNWEAILHAGSVRLSNLTLIVVDNRSSTVHMGDIAGKLAAFGWDAVTVDGRDRAALRAAYERRADGPTAIVAVVA
jgi:transketolase